MLPDVCRAYFREMLQLRDKAALPDRNTGTKYRFANMILGITKRERATILAALRRWLSYPAAREADFIATNGGKHKPLDNGEIERLCKRITKEEKKCAGRLLRRSNNGSEERKGLNLRDDMRTAQDTGTSADGTVPRNHH